MHDPLLYFGAVTAAAAVLVLPRLVLRLELSRAKHASLSGHARIARRLAALIPFYAYSVERFFRVDDAPDRVVALRRAGFQRLSRQFRERHASTLLLTRSVEPVIPDLQFTAA